jgi:hypothetical protein
MQNATKTAKDESCPISIDSNGICTPSSYSGTIGEIICWVCPSGNFNRVCFPETNPFNGGMNQTFPLKPGLSLVNLGNNFSYYPVPTQISEAGSDVPAPTSNPVIIVTP